MDSGRPPHISFFAGRIIPHRGGGERYNFHFLRAAQSLGLPLRGVTIVDMPGYGLLGHGPLWRLRHVWTCIWLSIQAIRSRRDRLVIDAWLAPYMWPWTFPPESSCWLVVHHFRHALQPMGQQQVWMAWCERRLLGRATRVLTISRSSEQQVRPWLPQGVPITVIPPGFDRPSTTGERPDGSGPLRLLYVGHMTRAKGVLDLLQAVALLPTKMDWVLHLVGGQGAEPETWIEVHRLREELGAAANRVFIHGYLQDERLSQLYASASIFVLPSHWEGYGIVLLEAMARGIAVVSCRVGAIPEVVSEWSNGSVGAGGGHLCSCCSTGTADD